MELKNKNILVAGVGKSGMAAARVLISKGATVALYDKKNEENISEQVKKTVKEYNIKCYWGREPGTDERFDYLIISPGISLEEEIVAFAKKNCGEIIGELELAYRISKGRYLAITGTNGKTTTTSLVGEILSQSGRNTFVVGNIGSPVVSAAVRSSESSWFAAEISSFQLETIREFRPMVSAILNITPDHLNRHKTFEIYAAVKARIFENQTEDDYFIVNKDCDVSWAIAQRCKAKVVPFSRLSELDFGCFVRDSKILIKDSDGSEIFICDSKDLQIPGTHNLENALAAAAICYFAGINPPIIGKALKDFGGVEHRIEFVKEINGVKYYNDSKGTNTDASKKAIDAMKKNIILIAGGYDKNEVFEPFIHYFDGRVKKMYLIGQTAQKIAAACEAEGFKNYEFKDDMEQCVESAKKLAQKGDIVLLSPACASWGMYDNFEQRGRHFKKCVEASGGK